MRVMVLPKTPRICRQRDAGTQELRLGRLHYDWVPKAVCLNNEQKTLLLVAKHLGGKPRKVLVQGGTDRAIEDMERTVDGICRAAQR